MTTHPEDRDEEDEAASESISSSSWTASGDWGQKECQRLLCKPAGGGDITGCTMMHEDPPPSTQALISTPPGSTANLAKTGDDTGKTHATTAHPQVHHSQ
jgi:hypothetical protein